MPRAHDLRPTPADRLPTKSMGGPIPDFGWSRDWDDQLGLWLDTLLQNIKDWTGIDLFWLLDWSWTSNSLLELVRQANEIMAWLQNPIQRPPNLLSRPSFSSPSAIASAPDWSWDPVVSLGTVEGPYGVLRTDPQGSAKTVADGSQHSMLSNAVSDAAALTPGQILVCEVHVLVEDGFTADDDQAIRLELVPSRRGVLQDAVVLASCGVPEDEPENWIAAPVGSKAVFFDVDYTVPVEDSPDAVELRLVVGKSAGGNVPVRFDGARVAAAGGFLVVLADLFDAGRIYLTEVWEAITAWLDDVFDPANWTALKTDTDTAFDDFVRRIKRALHHADADIFHPPSTSDIIANALKGNPWFGWIFEMVDDWLQPVLLTGKAGTAFWEAVWHALTAFAEAPGESGAWSTLMSAFNSAWDDLVDDLLEAWGSAKHRDDFVRPGTATTAALRNNEWFGWLFSLIDANWLQPVLKIGKAVVDFGEALWDAVATYVSNPLAGGAWPALVNALNDAWNDGVDAILLAWNPETTKTYADFPNPAEATEAILKNNPVTGWLWGSTYSGGDWLSAALSPITAFFDSIRKYINQMIEPLSWGYFDSDWLWVVARDTPDTEMPGSDPVLTPGANDGDDGQISPGADSTIPAAPKNVSAIPFWDITVSGFPAGNITYAIAAVKSGVEGPATQVKIFVGTLFPPNSATHVDLRWDAVSGASSYKVYRKADGYSTTTAWRLVASPSSNGTLLSPVVDNVARSSGSVAAPKTDAELAASIVTAVKSTATTAASTASTASSAASAAATAATSAHDAASEAAAAAAAADAAAALANDRLLEIPEGNIVVNPADPEEEDWGVTLLASAGATTWKATNNGGLTSGSVTWTQSIPSGAKAIYVFAATAGSLPVSARDLAITFSDTNIPLAGSAVTYKAGPEYATYSSGVLTNSGRSSIAVWKVNLPRGYSGTTTNITATWSGGGAVVDAASIVAGGSASGDVEIKTTGSTYTAPDDSLLVQFGGTFVQGTTAAAPSTFSGFTSARAVSDQASVQPKNEPAGAGTTITYGLGSRLATRNIDTGTSVTYSTSGSSTLQMLLVIKSRPNPGPTVGSFARIKSATGTVTLPNTGNIVRPLNNYFSDVDRVSPDITFTVATATFAVTYTGTYLLKVRMNTTRRVLVYVDDVLYEDRPGGEKQIFAELIYCASGAQISLKFDSGISGGTFDISGTPDDHVVLTLVNRSYL